MKKQPIVKIEFKPNDTVLIIHNDTTWHPKHLFRADKKEKAILVEFRKV